MSFEQEIMQELRKYANTKEGKKLIKKTYGIDYNDDPNYYKTELNKMAKQMREILYNHIVRVISSKYNKPPTTFQKEDIIIGKPQWTKDGGWNIRLFFNNEALHRESLYEDGYPEGVYDIVLLYTKGYKARNYVYGWSSRAKVEPWSTGHRSEKEREPNSFLRDAVREFNLAVGGEAVAKLIGKYV